jgi:ATP-dependent helicase/nuclease subunit B
LSPSDRARRAYMSLWTHDLLARPTAQQSIGTSLTLPRFLTLKAWFANLWSEGQLFGFITDSRTLISPIIETALWRHFASEVADMGSAESAVLASVLSEAWMLEHGYGDRTLRNGATPFAPNSSGNLYRSVRARFVDALRQRAAITIAELPGVLLNHVTHLTALVPVHILQTPSFAPLHSEQKALFALTTATYKCKLFNIDAGASYANPENTHIRRGVLADRRTEMQAAIEWARQSTTSSTEKSKVRQQFAIVVSDLRQSRGIWQRAIRETELPFNISLGLPVSAYPWAAVGFTLAGALTQKISTEKIAQALRHSRWGYSEAMKVAIGHRERFLLESDVTEITLPEFLNDSIKAFTPQFESIHAIAMNVRGRKYRTQWREAFEALIGALTLHQTHTTSDVFQLRAALVESINEWQALDQWLPALSITAAQQELIAITDQAAFQPEGSDAPVQVIGLLESAGVPFTAMWVTGMSERLLPETSRSNPFLAIAWQRERRAGLADADECEARAHRLVAGWQHATSALLASLPEKVDDEVQLWSPMALPWTLSDLTQTYSGLIPKKTEALVAIDDETAPHWQPIRATGTRGLEAQALCPRRGFSEARLRLRAWPVPTYGLSPQIRGELVHLIAEHLGRARKAETLDTNYVTKQLEEIVVISVAAIRAKRNEIPDYVWIAERDRLQRVFLKLLAQEDARPAFTVLDIEQTVETQIGALKLAMRIDRVDTLLLEKDTIGISSAKELPQHIIVIDFKSGNAINTKGLMDERLSTPQLPLYAHALGMNRIDAVAFARVSDDHQDFVGKGTPESGLAAKIRTKKDTESSEIDWFALRDQWPAKLSLLANELLSGSAELAPAYGQQTCTQCSLQRFCRVDTQALNGFDADASDGAHEITTDQ